MLRPEPGDRLSAELQMYVDSLLVADRPAANEAAAGASELTAGTAGAHAAFLVAALVSVPLIIGAIFIRKPADSIGGPVGH